MISHGPSTGSSTLRWPARRTTPGGTTCPGPSPNGGGGAGEGGSPARFIPLRRPVLERPEQALDRREPGHWEADLMAFGSRGKSLLTLQERHSRLLLAVPQETKASGPIAQRMLAPAAGIPRRVAPDGDLRQWDGVRPALPAASAGVGDLLLRHLLPVAEGRDGERDRQAEAVPAPQDQVGRVVTPAGGPGWSRPTTTLPASVWGTVPQPRCLGRSVALAM